MSKPVLEPFPLSFVDGYGLPWQESTLSKLLKWFKKSILNKKPSICDQILADLDKYPQWEWNKRDGHVNVSHQKLNYELWFGYHLTVDGQDILTLFEQFLIRRKWDSQKSLVENQKKKDEHRKIYEKFL